MSDDSSEIAAVKKELTAVKQRAVGKIKTLQQQVESLQQQLAEKNADHSSDASSEKSAGGGYVKVESPGARESLQRREAELREREEELNRREQQLQQYPTGSGSGIGSSSSGAAAPPWHAKLLAGLREIKAHAAQVDMAAESVGV